MSSPSPRAGDLVVKIRRRDDAAVEVAEIELLVRGVRVFVRQPDAEQHRGQAENLLEGRDDRDRSPFTVEDGRLAETFFNRAPGGVLK